MGADDRVRYVRQLARTRWDELVTLVDSAMLAATAMISIAVLLLRRGQRGFYGGALAIVAAVSIYAWGADGIEYWLHLLPAFAVLPAPRSDLAHQSATWKNTVVYLLSL